MSLINDINGDRITTLAGGGAPVSVPSTINGVGVGTTFDRDTVNLSAGLDSIAGSFSRSFIRFNQANTLLNLSETSVTDVIRIADEMIEVAELAADPDISDEQRGRLNSQFVELRREVTEVRAEAVIEDNNFLEKSDIENVLETAGIDLNKSSRVSEIFNRIGGSDATLTTESIVSEDVTVQVDGNAQTAVAPNFTDPLQGLNLRDQANATLTGTVLEEFKDNLEKDLEDIQIIRGELRTFLDFTRAATLVYDDAAQGSISENDADKLAERLASQIREQTGGNISEGQMELDSTLVAELLSSS